MRILSTMLGLLLLSSVAVAQPNLSGGISSGGGASSPYPQYTVDTLPETCTPPLTVDVTDAPAGDCSLKRCSPETERFVCAGAEEVPDVTVPGMKTTAVGILGQYFVPQDVSATTTLGDNMLVNVTIGATGYPLTVPDALTATVSKYIVRIVDDDTGQLTLVASGSNTFNFGQTISPLRNQGSTFLIERNTTSNWDVSRLSVPAVGILPSGTKGDIPFISDGPALKALTCAVSEVPTFQGTGSDVVCGRPVVTWIHAFDIGSGITCANPGPATRYLTFVGSTSSGTEAIVHTRSHRAMTVGKVKVIIPNNVPAGETVVVTLREAGGDTNKQVTTTAGNSESADTADTEDIADNALINVKVDCSGGTTAISILRVSFEVLQ